MSEPSQLYELVNPADEAAVLAEVRLVADSLGLTPQGDILARVHGDVADLFGGRHPAYRASNTSYHDLEHTLSVVLATLRLLHGSALALGEVAPEPFLLGVAAAYFHDTGLIQHHEETQGTGARHTVGHEVRSAAVMRAFLEPLGIGAQDLDEAEAMIRCTELAGDPSQVPFRTPQAARAGLILGTADLAAQIADRNYLEKLPHLFREFEEAGLPGFSSELDLMLKTRSFYEQVARPRMDGPLGGQMRYMVHHFRERWGIGQDLYALAISRNLAHLEHALTTCGGSYDCLMALLKRRPGLRAGG